MRSTSEVPSSPYSTASTRARGEIRRSRASGSLPPTVEDEEEREVEQMDEFATVNESDENRNALRFRANEDEEEDRHRSWTLQDRMVDKGEGTPSPQKFKPVLKPLAPTEAEGYSTPRAKKEKITTPAHSTRAPPKSDKTPRHDLNPITPSSSVDPESRFEISIVGPGPNQVAQFKTRGKHTVGKVLAAACKTFDIDATQARLYHSILLVNDNGDMEQHELECGVEETMAQFGGAANPELFIKLNSLVEREDDLLNFN